MRWVAVCLLIGIAGGVPTPFATRPSLAAASAVARQSDEGASRLWNLRSWVTAVEEHEPGTYDPAAFSVDPWDPDQLEAVGRDLLTLSRFLASGRARVARSGRPPTLTYQGRTLSIADIQQLLGLTDEETQRGDVNRLLKRGALLHADIAMLAPPRSRVTTGMTPAASQDLVFLYRDGRLQGVESAGAHWRLGRTLLDAVSPDPSRDEMVREWYRATGAHLQAAHAFVYATPHLSRARELFPGDARILLYSGALHESLATSRVQSVLDPSQRASGSGSGILSARAELQRAESLLRQAVRSEPALAEARVRLGRVLDLLGRHEEGAAELRRAASATGDALLLYYADLFLGQAELALSHRDQANAGFERAASRYPRAQSPRLALSQLAHRNGNRAGALGAIRPVLDLPASEGEREDPWWYYNEVHVPDVDRLLAELREPFLAVEPR